MTDTGSLDGLPAAILSPLLPTLAALPLPLLVPIPTFLALVTIYHTLAPFFPDERSRAYILAACSSAGMTLASLPFVAAYVSGGLQAAWDAGQSGWTGALASGVVGAFGTYLFTDLLVGYFRYPSQVGLLTGWIHHIVYMGLCIYLATCKKAPILLLAAIMELPTFDLAISNLFPSVRSDERFLTLMILFRIGLCAVLLVDCARPSSRALTEDSWVPTVMVGLALSLHTMWTHGGVKGYLRRRSKKAQGTITTEAKAEAVEPTQVVPPSKTLVEPAEMLDVATPDFGAMTPDESPLVTPHTPGQPVVAIMDNFFPAITMPTMPNLPIPAIPTLSGMAAALPQAKDHLNNLNFGFKDAMRERWQEQRERLAAAGMLRRRRRAGVPTDIIVAETDSDAI